MTSKLIIALKETGSKGRYVLRPEGESETAERPFRAHRRAS